MMILSEENKQKMQEVLDYAVMGIVTQGGPSLGKSGREPKYRGEGGRCCPVGLLISDDNYKPSFEGMLVEVSIIREALPFEIRSNRALLDFVIGLQATHDDAVSRIRYLRTERQIDIDDEFFIAFEEHINLLCVLFGLEYPDHLI